MVFGGLAIAIVLGVVGLFGREKIVMAVGSYVFRNDVATLKQLAYKDSVGGNCGSNGENGGILGYQLRFVSEIDYVIEPVCSSLGQAQPVKSARLMGGVRRLYGSGIMIRIENGIPMVDDAWVHLRLGQAVTAVGLFDGLPKVVWNASALAIGGNSPAQAKCAEWGFACCVDGKEVGQLAQVRTYDCPAHCYQACDQLPVVLFFNTDPVMNPKMRQTVVPNSRPVVTFGYQVTDDQGLGRVMVDFGDGKKADNLPDTKQDLIHEYRCDRNTCVYTARILATDINGNELVRSAINTVQVVVQ